MRNVEKISIFCGFAAVAALEGGEARVRRYNVGQTRRAPVAARAAQLHEGATSDPVGKELKAAIPRRSPNRGGMKAVIFERFGEPREVLAVRDVPLPEPGAGQVRVRMIASPVNPSDLLVVRGQYGRLPKLPATPGFEGVGIIDKAGPGAAVLRWVRGLKPGRRVAVLHREGGNWQQFVIVPARQCVPVPADLPDEQVASFFVNPATVIIMTQGVLRVAPGTWLLQTAAGSALGRMIIR